MLLKDTFAIAATHDEEKYKLLVEFFKTNNFEFYEMDRDLIADLPAERKPYTLYIRYFSEEEFAFIHNLTFSNGCYLSAKINLVGKYIIAYTENSEGNENKILFKYENIIGEYDSEKKAEAALKKLASTQKENRNIDLILVLYDNSIKDKSIPVCSRLLGGLVR